MISFESRVANDMAPGVSTEIEKVEINKMKMSTFTKKYYTVSFLFVVCIALTFSQNVNAFEITQNPQISVENNFVVGPAKIELSVVSGGSKTATILVENRTGKKQTFKISFEDFVAGSGDSAVSLLGLEKSKTSLKDFMFVEKNTFTLNHGERLILPVTVSIPANSNPGGKFASVLVSAIADTNRVTESDSAYTGSLVLGRIGSLFFVTVPGNTLSSGELLSIKTKNQQKLFFTNRIPLRVEYKNSGNISLNPYGIIEIKNIFGEVVSKKILDPWFTLPESIRTRDILVEGSFFGRYTAVAQVNRGYEDIVDSKSFTFYVVSNEALVLISILVLVLFFVIWKKKDKK